MPENVTVAEVLALKAIVRVLLAEKLREFKDSRSRSEARETNRSWGAPSSSHAINKP